MKKYEIVRIREHPELLPQAAAWFHQKWGIPESAYAESMEACAAGGKPVPQWYIVLGQNKIIAGSGVIDNDFHARKDLTPNVCAVYVEEEYRCQGIAGDMLRFICGEFAEMGMKTLYLVTDHTSFYERYDWEFFCMVQSDGEEKMSRMYKYQS